MKIAFECPTPMLNQIQPLADYDFILAHLVLQDTRYAQYYRNSKRMKILDNSCNELLKPLSVKELQKADEIVGSCDWIVAPDFLGDRQKTVQSLCTEMPKYFTKERILPVIQGDCVNDACRCGEELIGLGFHNLAVPYDIGNVRTTSTMTMAASRETVINSLHNISPRFVSFHLLGVTLVEELENYVFCKLPIDTVDTGLPILQGLKNERMDLTKVEFKTIPTYNQMKELGEGALETVFFNIAYLRKVLNA